MEFLYFYVLWHLVHVNIIPSFRIIISAFLALGRISVVTLEFTFNVTSLKANCLLICLFSDHINFLFKNITFFQIIYWSVYSCTDVTLLPTCSVNQLLLGLNVYLQPETKFSTIRLELNPWCQLGQAICTILCSISFLLFVMLLFL